MMLNENDSGKLKETLSHHAEIEHRERMDQLYFDRDIQDAKLITALGIKPTRDGNQWCFLWGEDLQTGVAGFGDTPLKAARDFIANYQSEI